MPAYLVSVCSMEKTLPRLLTIDYTAPTPADGRLYDLVDGRLDVTPVPVFLHTRVEARLGFFLELAVQEEHELLPGPGINFNADRTHHRIPDLAVIRAEDAESPYLTRPPLLAV